MSTAFARHLDAVRLRLFTAIVLVTIALTITQTQRDRWSESNRQPRA